ncbi:unnamed protein product [Ascophyllum nodosum]
MLDSTDIAREAFLAVQVRPGEEWRNLASRLVLNYRTVVADPYRPHASEATYFWRYATERQLHELFEGVINAVRTNPLDRLSLNALRYDAVERVKREARKSDRKRIFRVRRPAELMEECDPTILAR